MNNLKFKDVSTILNEVFKAVVNNDEDARTVVSDNLSNIADVGAVLTENTDYETLFNKTFPAMVDKVKTTKFINRTYVGSAPPCAVAPDTFRGIVEIVRTDVGSFDVNHLFDVIDRDDNFTGTLEHFADLFGKELPTVEAKYYTMCRTYRQKITKTSEQFIGAFTNADAMMSFFASIESALAVKYDFAVDMLQYLTFDSAVVEKIAKYNANTDTMLANGSLVRSEYTYTDDLDNDAVVKIINEMKSIVRLYKKFNTYGGADFANSYASDDIHIAINAKLYDAMITNNAFAMHDEFLAIPFDNIHPITSFMPYDTTDDVANVAISGKAHNGTEYIAGALMYVIYTAESFACTVIDKKITSQYVADEDYTNVFHNATMSNVVNVDFPITICIAHNGAIA